MTPLCKNERLWFQTYARVVAIVSVVVVLSAGGVGPKLAEGNQASWRFFGGRP